MKLIVSGVPCCGKTHFGDWLRDFHGFAHANLEGRQSHRSQIHPPNITADLPDWLASIATNIVVTWGFPPNQPCIELIRRFQAAGFTAWWFDADYAVARIRYVDREGLERTEKFFDPQIQKLTQATSSLKALYLKHTITTLTNEGFKSVEEIYRTVAT